MNTATRNKTKGLVQITRKTTKTWDCSVVIYGELHARNTVNLTTTEVIKLLRTLGAPAPTTSKESHVVEFYNHLDWSRLKTFGFVETL